MQMPLPMVPISIFVICKVLPIQLTLSYFIVNVSMFAEMSSGSVYIKFKICTEFGNEPHNPLAIAKYSPPN